MDSQCVLLSSDPKKTARDHSTPVENHCPFERACIFEMNQSYLLKENRYPSCSFLKRSFMPDPKRGLSYVQAPDPLL